MSNEDKIKEILQQFKNILQSYVGLWDRITIDAGHREDAPEYKFDRRQMTDPRSNLFAMVGSLFMNKPLSQALQQIDFWRVMYIETGISKDKIEWGETDEFKGWAAIGQAFLDNARAVAARWCVDDVHPQGEQPQGGGGIDHQNKVQQKKTQTEAQVLQLPELPDTLNTDRAKEVFGKAIEKGLIVVSGNGLKKQGISKAQLAYMLQRIYIPDATGADGKQFPETALNGLFDESRLGEALRKLADNKNTNGKPRGYQVIDGLFNDK